MPNLPGALLALTAGLVTIAFALALALAVGLSLGLLGGGGSILTVPILVYVLGMGTKQAIATSLLIVGVTSSAALLPYARARLVNLRAGLILGAASMLGAFAGGRLAHHVPAPLLLLAFALGMLVTGVALLRGRQSSQGSTVPHPERVPAVGLVIGLLTGMIGAGGGFVIVPALTLLCGLELRAAVGTSLLVIVLNSFSGLAGALGHVHVDLGVAAPLVAASVAGSFGGARVAGRVSERALRRGFGWLVLATAGFMLWREASAIAGGAAVVIAAVVGAWRELLGCGAKAWRSLTQRAVQRRGALTSL